MNDIALRAVKTFIQAFFGVLLPELYVFCQPDFPVDMSTPAIIFTPMLCASLAAGISAVGNMFANLFLPADPPSDGAVDPIDDPLAPMYVPSASMEDFED